MKTEQLVYRVSLVIGSSYDDVDDPEFVFLADDEKDKMLAFIDACIDNGHEIKIAKDTVQKEIRV